MVILNYFFWYCMKNFMNTRLELIIAILAVTELSALYLSRYLSLSLSLYVCVCVILTLRHIIFNLFYFCQS